MVLINNSRGFRSHLIIDCKGIIKLKLKILFMYMLNSYCNLWKVLWTCVTSFIDCLNPVYNNSYCWIFTQTEFQQQINNSFLQIHKLCSTFLAVSVYANHFLLWVQICDATRCFVNALPMGQIILLDKTYTKQLG